MLRNRVRDLNDESEQEIRLSFFCEKQKCVTKI